MSRVVVWPRIAAKWLAIFGAGIAAGLTEDALALTAAGGASFELPWARVVIALLACVALSALVIVLVRGRMETGGAKSLFGVPAARGAEFIAVLETRRLSLHADACRVAWNGKEYLLVVGAGGALLLDQRERRADA